jgi:hypothetical protein
VSIIKLKIAKGLSHEQRRQESDVREEKFQEGG